MNYPPFKYYIGQFVILIVEDNEELLYGENPRMKKGKSYQIESRLFSTTRKENCYRLICGDDKWWVSEKAIVDKESEQLLFEFMY